MAMHLGERPGADDDDAVISEINTTPLIDVMLVLLIMLIVTIPIQTHAVNLLWPTAASAAPPRPPQTVAVVVQPDGSVWWQGQPLADRAALEARLRAVAAQGAASAQDQLQLRPDADAPYHAVAAVLASAQRLGARRIGLVGHERFLP